MSAPNPDRPDMTRDLTRWNRAGLTRFRYVDGDAAVWLEELRLALFGLYLRGEPAADRLPERWRDLFLKPVEEWPTAARMEEIAARVDWARLAPSRPPRAESRGQRNRRLLDQYEAPPDGDHAWEILRAFARAADVLLGHLDAYANEGYLRTATQWDNLRRLAAMVNYQPGPPASATTTVALTLKPDAGTVRIGRGLAMKAAPAGGGAPLVFETLAVLDAHPDLNAVRVEDWDVNATPLPLGTTTALPVDWLKGPKTALDPGDLVVVARGEAGDARAVAATSVGEIALTVTLDRGLNGAVHSGTMLWIAADDVRVAEPQGREGRLVIETVAPMAVGPGDILWIRDGSRHASHVEVVEVRGDAVVVSTDRAFAGGLEILPLVPLAADDEGFVRVPVSVSRVWFSGPGGPVSTAWGDEGETRPELAPDGRTGVNRLFAAKGFTATRGFRHDAAMTAVEGKVRPSAAPVLPDRPADATRTASFAGKPPKSLAVGSWFALRPIEGGTPRALRVVGLSAGPGRYHVLFHDTIDIPPERAEFHGPMTEALRPVGWNRNPLPGAPGKVARLTGLSPEARLLLKPGRSLIVSRGPDDALATIATVSTGDAVEITLATSADLSDWAAGDMLLRLNAVLAGHGETKPPRLLGSGDAEQPLQSFRLPVKEVSHIPSTIAEAGVVPDMDVAVDGVVWPWRDLVDVTAEGAKAWSSSLTEDGEILVRFRRRLPTGTNNVTVLRHRVGTGGRGSGLAAFSFTKPMKKHPQVDAIHQPFVTAGGADREPVASLRLSAPSRLAANGRAVSARDFERLAMRVPSVWRARAEERPGGGAMRELRLTLVTADGQPLSPDLTESLRVKILKDAIPGVRLSFALFETLPLRLEAVVRADLVSFDAADVKAAAEAALWRAFGLQARDFGQPVHRAEILAALEAVPQVETAVVTRFDLAPPYDLSQPRPEGSALPWPANVALLDGAVAAIYPAGHQVAHLPGPLQPEPRGMVSVTVEGLT
ncbi:hypothetical protein LAZ40_22440 [Cereibacter sphaeroides]|uniref:hypothetical protein n=1 Tax=Cereibacter sphaeroides TaxID=1063 RepID=UPI001F37912F|nr:hypothetical protein [Cereibacter sphaeroides]MCE6961798.1 hypothetical protein [Cereibacter sphaeroides]MCE6975831.1 hypothetical protein [Cereibacter sphaeroides]